MPNAKVIKIDAPSARGFAVCYGGRIRVWVRVYRHAPPQIFRMMADNVVVYGPVEMEPGDMWDGWFEVPDGYSVGAYRVIFEEIAEPACGIGRL